jgi:hypothetical protein
MSTHEDTTPVVAAMRSTLLVVLCVILLLAGLQLGASGAVGQPASDDSHTTYLPFVFQAAPVEVAVQETLRTRPNTYRIMGELANLTNSPAYSVTLEVRIYDAADNVIATHRGQPVLFATVPGQRNPFDIYTNISRLTGVRADVHVVDWRLSHSPPFAPVTVVSVSARETGGNIVVSGELRNDTDYVLEEVRVAAWRLYPDAVQANYVAAESLAPGDSVPYEVTLFLNSTGPPRDPPPLPNGVSAQGIVRP